MTSLIDPRKYSDAVDLLRSFFLSKNFLEVHTQNRLSILAACEDPETVATYNYGGNIWPLPQTCLLYTSPSPRDATLSRMPSSA